MERLYKKKRKENKRKEKRKRINVVREERYKNLDLIN